MRLREVLLGIFITPTSRKCIEPRHRTSVFTTLLANDTADVTLQGTHQNDNSRRIDIVMEDEAKWIVYAYRVARAATGNVKQKRLPSPATPELSTQMCSPMASTNCLLM